MSFNEKEESKVEEEPSHIKYVETNKQVGIVNTSLIILSNSSDEVQTKSMLQQPKLDPNGVPYSNQPIDENGV